MFMERFGGQTYAVLRIVTGFLFLWHGMQKIFGFPVPPEMEIPMLMKYFTGGFELIGGLFVMAGFMTRWTAFLCSGFMAAAYWIAHGTNHILPLLNQGELAALYCFIFLFISAHGSGRWSLDEMLQS